MAYQPAKAGAFAYVARLQSGKGRAIAKRRRILLASFAVLPRPVEMAMVPISVMDSGIVGIRMMAFCSVVALRRPALGMSLLGNVFGLIVLTLSMMRHGGRRIIGREWNVYMFLS